MTEFRNVASVVEVACAHHALGELPRGQLVDFAQLLGAKIRNLALLEETVTDHISRPLLLDIREQAEGRVQMGQIMLSLGDLSFIGRDPPVDLCPLVLQRFDNQRLVHVPHSSHEQPQCLAANLVCLRHKSAVFHGGHFQ